MKLRILTPLIAAAMLTIAYEPAMAQERGGRSNQLMGMLDLDANGKVSLEEIGGENKRRVSAVDLDGNGLISPDEFRRRGQLLLAMRTTTIFDLLDGNGDGNLTADELTAPSGRWVARYDQDGDGALSAEELAATSPSRGEDSDRDRRRRGHR